MHIVALLIPPIQLCCLLPIQSVSLPVSFVYLDCSSNCFSMARLNLTVSTRCLRVQSISVPSIILLNFCFDKYWAWYVLQSILMLQSVFGAHFDRWYYFRILLFTFLGSYIFVLSCLKRCKILWHLKYTNMVALLYLFWSRHEHELLPL